MKALPSKRCIHARRRGLVHDAEREIVDQLVHLEPWQRAAIIPGAHVIKVDIREVWPNGRAYCTCGYDSGWIPLWDAEQRAQWHRLEGNKSPLPISDRVGDRERRAGGEQGDTVMLDHTLFANFARRKHRDLSGPVVPLPILGVQQPTLLVFDQRDLAIELAYERRPISDGTRVRSTTRDTTQYWIPRLTPVLAISEGIIVYAHQHSEGHSVIIDHGDWLSVYHRLEHMFVAPTERQREGGAAVSTGDVLGYLAPTEDGPIKPLRFELFEHDRNHYDPIDPLRYIRRWRHVRWESPSELSDGPAQPDQRGEGGEAAAGDGAGDPVALESPGPAEAGE